MILMLVNYAWGKPDDKNKFKLTQNVFSKFPKDHDSISFHSYVENNYQFSNDQEENDKIAYLQIIRKLRHEQFMNFLKSGSGVKLKPDFDKINKAIQLPKVINDDLFNLDQQTKQMMNNEEGAQEISEIQKIILQIFQCGYVYILPILYKTFQNLKKAKKEFSIVFRSNNQQNLEKFVAEFNLFCTGEHPQFNGKNNFPLIRHDGFKNSKSYVILPQNLLTIYQNPSLPLKMQGLFGNIHNKPQDQIHQIYQKELKEQTVSIEKGEKIYVRMLENFKETCACAILENKTSLLVDSYDYNVLQVYFTGDEVQNFEVLDVVTGKQILNEEKQWNYLDFKSKLV